MTISTFFSIIDDNGGQDNVSSISTSGGIIHASNTPGGRHNMIFATEMCSGVEMIMVVSFVSSAAGPQIKTKTYIDPDKVVLVGMNYYTS